MAKYYIYVNNKHSYDDLELFLEAIELPSSNEETEEIEVEGRNGSLTIKKGNYPDKVIDAKFMLKRNSFETVEDFYMRIEEIEEWLKEAKGDLIIYLKPNRSYKVKHTIVGDITPDNIYFVNFDVTFICEPFSYLLSERSIEVPNNSTTHYKGTVEGECNIKIYGTGNIQLTVNDDTVQISNVNGYVELDSKLLLCLNLDKTSKSRDMIGNFPLLVKGENKISWTGNVSKVEILPRTAYR